MDEKHRICKVESGELQEPVEDFSAQDAKMEAMFDAGMTDTLLKAQDLLSSLTINSRIPENHTDFSARPQSAGSSMKRSPEVPEHERQRLVELDVCQRIVDLKKSLTSFGESHGIRYVTYNGEHHLKEIMELITKDLSEPYSIYTYRYFIYQWPKLCHLVSILSANRVRFFGTIISLYDFRLLIWKDES